MLTNHIFSEGGYPMNVKRSYVMMVLLAISGLIVSACSINIDRNPDGSLRVEVNLPESTIQEEIEAALNDPLINEFTVDLHQGYITTAAERRRVFGDELDMLTFRLDLGITEGHLTATISEAKVNDQPVDDAVVAVWNERIANKLENAGKRNPDASLQSVSIDETALHFLWRVETARSKRG
jgi:hypothetical protein